MKSLLFALLFIFSTVALSAQQSNVDLCNVYQNAHRNKSLDTFNFLINLDSTEVNRYEKAELLSLRAKTLLEMSNMDSIENTPSGKSVLREAHQDLTTAIDLFENENDKLTYQFRRYFLLEEYKSRYKEYIPDLKTITANGYRRDKFGLALTAVTRYDGEFWLGAEFSIFSGYSPPHRLKDANNRTISRNKYSNSASALVFGYSQNVETSISDFNFTLLRIETPLFIDVTQFGVIETNESNHWYYRPELGFGYAIFHLSFGYNVFFKSDKAKSLNRAILNFRIKHTF